MSREKTAALLSLMSSCLPENEELKHDSLLEEITVMKVYQDLAQYPPFQNVFERYFTMDVLEKMRGRELERIKLVIPKAVECLHDIINSLQRGAAPELTEEDIPDFHDWDQINRLQSKLLSRGSLNYTNITPEHFMTVFSRDTVKSGKDLFRQMDANEKDFAKSIALAMKDQPYCISKKEMEDLEEGYQRSVNEVGNNMKSRKRGIVWRLAIKLACCILASMMPALMASLTGTMNASMIDISGFIILIASIIFLIGG